MCRSPTKEINGTIVPPTIPSGFQKRRGIIIGALLLQTFLFAAAYFVQKSGVINLKPADEYCQNQDSPTKCTRADLFAFQLCCGVMLFYTAYVGTSSWFITKTAHNSIPATLEGRLFGRIEDGEKLMVVVFSFQFWDLIASMMIEEHSDVLFLAHHFMAALIAYFSLEYEYVHHYALYAGGVSEFSSIFLFFVDLAKFFPPKEDTPAFSFIFICQALFAVTFFLFRILGWFKVSVRLWSDGIYALMNGVAEQYRPGKSYVLVTFLAVNGLLGALQALWFYQIAEKVVEVLSE